MNLNGSGGVETAERQAPEIVLRSEYLPDTGGAGANRGGAASLKDAMTLYPIGHRFSCLHLKQPIAGGGVFGGKAGVMPAGWLWEGDLTEFGTRPVFLPMTLSHPVYGDASPQLGLIDPVSREVDPNGQYISQSVEVAAGAGAYSRVLTSGGGGWGDPLDRDPERVKADVRDEYVSLEAAARDYGVVITGDPARHPEGLVIEKEATRRLRDDMRRRSNSRKRTPVANGRRNRD
jgi:N-methylhydantoinase B